MIHRQHFPGRLRPREAPRSPQPLLRKIAAQIGVGRETKHRFGERVGADRIDGLGGQTGPDLSRAGRLDEADIRRQIVTPQDEEMPAYDGLSPQQLVDLVAFLKSLN